LSRVRDYSFAKIRRWWYLRGGRAKQSGSRAGGAARKEQEKKFFTRGSAQPIEKAQNRQGIPRKSKLFSFHFLCQALAGLAGFAKIWNRVGKTAIVLTRSVQYQAKLAAATSPSVT
jgi:hypothetical protein